MIGPNRIPAEKSGDFFAFPVAHSLLFFIFVIAMQRKTNKAMKTAAIKKALKSEFNAKFRVKQEIGSIEIFTDAIQEINNERFDQLKRKAPRELEEQEELDSINETLKNNRRIRNSIKKKLAEIGHGEKVDKDAAGDVLSGGNYFVRIEPMSVIEAA